MLLPLDFKNTYDPENTHNKNNNTNKQKQNIMSYYAGKYKTHVRLRFLYIWMYHMIHEEFVTFLEEE
jgi:hypothetical protein